MFPKSIRLELDGIVGKNEIISAKTLPISVCLSNKLAVLNLPGSAYRCPFAEGSAEIIKKLKWFVPSLVVATRSFAVININGAIACSGNLGTLTQNTALLQRLNFQSSTSKEPREEEVALNHVKRISLKSGLTMPTKISRVG